MQMKRVVKQMVLALAATGVLLGQALAAQGWDAEPPGVQSVQVALAGPATALPEQVVLVEREPTAQVVEYSAKLPAVLPELPAALAVAEPAPFSAADMQALFVPSTEPLRVAVLSAQEMEETQGAVAPLVAVGLMHGGRLVLTGFTRHGLNQVISRDGVGVSNRAILNALRNPLAGSQSFITGRNAGTTRFVGSNASVVINRSGQIVSAWARNSAGRR